MRELAAAAERVPGVRRVVVEGDDSVLVSLWTPLPGARTAVTRRVQALVRRSAKADASRP